MADFRSSNLRARALNPDDVRVLAGVLVQRSSCVREVLDQGFYVIGQLPEWFTIGSAAEITGLSESTIRRRLGEGAFPSAFKDRRAGAVGGAPWRLHRTDLESLVSGGRLSDEVAAIAAAAEAFTGGPTGEIGTAALSRVGSVGAHSTGESEAFRLAAELVAAERLRTIERLEADVARLASENDQLLQIIQHLVGGAQ